MAFLGVHPPPQHGHQRPGGVVVDDAAPPGEPTLATSSPLVPSEDQGGGHAGAGLLPRLDPVRHREPPCRPGGSGEKFRVSSLFMVEPSGSASPLRRT